MGGFSEDSADDELHDDATHGAKEFTDAQSLARRVSLLHERVLTVRLKGGARGGPDEVGTVDPRVPEVPELLSDIRPHCLQHPVVPSCS